MKILFFSILIIYALVLITRYVAPLLLKYFLKKLATKFENQMQQENSPSHSNVYTDKKINSKTSKSASKKEPKVGEYIDFEEID